MRRRQLSQAALALAATGLAFPARSAWAQAAAGGAAAPSGVPTVETNGVKFPTEIELRGTKLLLNGAGTRYRFVKVYAMALYLPQKATTPQAALAMQGPKSIRIQMLREINADELGKLFTRAMEDNASRDEFAKSINSIIRMGQIFADQRKLNAGDPFQLDFIPGTGTTLTIRGKPQGEPFKEPEYWSLLLKIWIGPKPAEALLKDALLGEQNAVSAK
jgi:hypothetical protein